MEKVNASKKIDAFRDPLSPISNLSTYSSSPAAREPIFVAILLNLPRKKETLKQKANVSQGKTKMGMVRGR
jgi:hypothetical protein